MCSKDENQRPGRLSASWGRTRRLLREGFKKDVRLHCALKSGKGLIKDTKEGAEGVGTVRGAPHLHSVLRGQR